MQDDSPVAELVAKPFDEQRAVSGQLARGRALIGEVGCQVVCGPQVEPQRRGALLPGSWRDIGGLAHECPDGGPKLVWSADVLALPERKPGRFAEGRHHDDPVVGDLYDAPTGRPESKDIVDSRLID